MSYSLEYNRKRLLALQEEIEKMEMLINLKFAPNDVLKFIIQYGGVNYHYAAICVRISANDNRWFVTGKAREGQYLSYESFCEQYLMKAIPSSILRAVEWQHAENSERMETEEEPSEVEAIRQLVRDLVQLRSDLRP